MTSLKRPVVEDFTSLAADPRLLRDTVIQSDRFLQDVKRRALESGDQSLVNMAANVLQRASTVTDVATLESLAQIAGNVSDLDAEFGEFIKAVHKSNKRIDDRLDKHNVLLGDIGEKLVGTRRRHSGSGCASTRLGRNQDSGGGLYVLWPASRPKSSQLCDQG